MNGLKIGTRLKLIGGVREWAYAGLDPENGKILLRFPGDPHLFICVARAEIDWQSVKEK